MGKRWTKTALAVAVVMLAGDLSAASMTGVNSGWTGQRAYAETPLESYNVTFDKQVLRYLPVPQQIRMWVDQSFEPYESTQWAVWESSDPTIATVDKGLVTFTGKHGTAVIRATATTGWATGTKTLTVTVDENSTAAVRLSLSPLQYRGEGTENRMSPTLYGQGVDLSVGDQVTYSSSNPDVATVDAQGVVRYTDKPGDVTITGTLVTPLGTYTGSSSVKVDPQAGFAKIEDADGEIYHPTQLKLIGRYYNGTPPTSLPTGQLTPDGWVYPADDGHWFKQIPNELVTWSSDNQDVAVIDQDGIVSYTGANGIVTFTATTRHPVQNETSWSVRVDSSVRLEIGWRENEWNLRDQLVGIELYGRLTNGEGHSLQEDEITYRSTNPAVAIYDGNHIRYTGVGGTTDIIAEYRGLTATKTIHAENMGTPNRVSIWERDTFAYSATPERLTASVYYLADSMQLYKGMGGLTWSSSNPDVATVDNGGVVTFTGKDGPVTITVNFRGLTSSATTEVDLVPHLISMFIDGNTQYSAAPSQLKAFGVLSKGQNPVALENSKVTWTSSDPSIARIDANGLLTFTGKSGLLTITARSEGKQSVVTTNVKGTGTSPSTGGGTSPSTGGTSPSTDDPTTPAPDTTAPVPEDPSDFAPLNLATNTAIQQRMIDQVLDSEPLGAIPDYSDIKGHWAYTNIKMAKKLGFASGYGDNSFQPNQTITRAEFMTMLCRAFEIPQSANTSELTDASGHWASGHMAALKDRGIVGGYADGSMKPNQQITRAEVVTILTRLLDTHSMSADADTQANFQDTGAHWAKSAIDKSAELGIVSGVGSGQFAPNKSTTRAETVTILLNTMKLNPTLKALFEAYM